MQHQTVPAASSGHEQAGQRTRKKVETARNRRRRSAMHYISKATATAGSHQPPSPPRLCSSGGRLRCLFLGFGFAWLALYDRQLTIQLPSSRFASHDGSWAHRTPARVREFEARVPTPTGLATHGHARGPGGRPGKSEPGN